MRTYSQIVATHVIHVLQIFLHKVHVPKSKVFLFQLLKQRQTHSTSHVCEMFCCFMWAAPKIVPHLFMLSVIRSVRILRYVLLALFVNYNLHNTVSSLPLVQYVTAQIEVTSTVIFTQSCTFKTTNNLILLYSK